MVNPLEKVKTAEESCKKELEEYLKKREEELLNMEKDYKKKLQNLFSFLEPEIKEMEREAEEFIKKIAQANEKELKVDTEKLKNIEKIRVQKGVDLLKEEFLKSLI